MQPISEKEQKEPFIIIRDCRRRKNSRGGETVKKVARNIPPIAVTTRRMAAREETQAQKQQQQEPLVHQNHQEDQLQIPLFFNEQALSSDHHQENPLQNILSENIEPRMLQIEGLQERPGRFSESFDVQNLLTFMNGQNEDHFHFLE